MPKRFVTTYPVRPYSQDIFIDTQIYQEFLRLLKGGQHIHLIGGRQKGKTSAILSASQALVAEGHVCAEMTVAFHTGAVELRELVAEMFDECGTVQGLATGTLDREGSFAYALKKALQKMAEFAPEGKRVYLFIDELDAIWKYKPAEITDFLAGLRNFAVSREKDLTLITASVITPEKLERMSPAAGSPQPIFGKVLSLAGFPADEKTVAQLIEGFPCESCELSDALLKMLQWTMGHPQPTITFCDNWLQLLNAGGEVWTSFEKVQSEMHLHASNHIGALRHQLSSRQETMPPLLHLYEEIARAEARGQPRRYEHLSENLAYLESIGLVRRESDSIYRVASEFYRQVINETWINDLLTQHYNILQGKRRSTRTDKSSNILVLLTGGTIGMRIESGQAIFRQSWVKDVLADDLERIASIEIEFLEPKDGINMHPEDWVAIFNKIQFYRKKEWADAIVVAQGTDTLTYSACGLAFAYGASLDFPLIFTGAQCTLDVVHGDARLNMIRSCRIAVEAIEAKANEVMICFDDQVYKACRAQKVHDQHFRGFASPTWPILAQVSEEVVFNRDALMKGSDHSKSPEVLFCNNILYINIVPGLKEAVFSQAFTDVSTIDGIILATPGAGNIPREGSYSFHTLITKAVENGIPVLINSQVPIDSELYSTYRAAHEPVKKGAIFAGNMTQAAALTKFSWAIKKVRAEGFKGADLITKVTGLMNESLIDETGEFGGQSPSLKAEEPRSISASPVREAHGKQEICIIMTGGTIGMINHEGANEFKMKAIRSFLEPDLQLMARITFVDYNPKDGIDMNLHDWKKLFETVQKHRNEGMDGFVIAHGTDTLAYSASALAFAFGPSLSFPIVFTGAQTTPDRLHGDSRINIIRAVYVASQASKPGQIIPEVMVSFADQVYRAVRSEKVHDQYFQGFASPAWPILAQITDSLKVNWHAVRELSSEKYENTGFAENILFINIVPGLNVEIYNQFLNFEKEIDGAILATPGAGNIPNQGAYNFHSFLRLAQEKSVPVLVTSQVPVSPSTDYHYKAAQDPIDSLGAISAGNMTQAAALTKFAWAIAMEQRRAKGNALIQAVADFMGQQLVGELSGIN